MRSPLPGYLQPQFGTPNQRSLAPPVTANCRRYYPFPPNEYDACLAQEKAEWDMLVTQGLDYLCCPRGRRSYFVRPWIQQPELGRPFNEIGSLAVSTFPSPFDATDQAVLTVTCPEGYDGVINYFVCGIGSVNATGFIEGSGSITWRLSAAGRYLRDMGSILFSQGSLITPCPTPNGGLRIYSGNIIKFTAALAVGADVTLNPQAVIVCACKGWFYSK